MLDRQVTCLVSGVNMETYHGHVKTPADAIILFEACRIGRLPRVQRRLSEKERGSIRSGSIFVWDEREAGMRRWTDGKSWSASRVSGSFLTYREMEGKRGGSGLNASAAKSSRDSKSTDGETAEDGPDGYRYKADGLMKQSFSITTSGGQHLHLISYYSRNATPAQDLMQPTNDQQLRHIRPEKGMYPESTVHDQASIPAVTRGPMVQQPYSTSSPQPTPMNPPYGRLPPQGQYNSYAPPGWAPPSPLHTPPPTQHYSQSYPFGNQSYYPPAYSATSQHPPTPYGQSQYAPGPPGPPGPTVFDRPPPPMSNKSLPPMAQSPHPTSHPAPPPYAQQQAQSSAGRYSFSERSAHAPAMTHGASAPEIKSEDTGARHDSFNNPFAAKQKSASPPSSSAGAPSATTIPGINYLLNMNAPAPADDHDRRPGSLSPNSRKPQEIPLQRLGFAPHSDAKALRVLDTVTFRGSR